MNDPHVERLHYEIGAGPNFTYAAPPPLEVSTTFGEVLLQDGRLSFSPAEHFATEEEARAVLDPFLRAWELETDLARNLGTIRFKYLHADIVDRDPPLPGSPQVLVAKAAGVVWLAGELTVHLTVHRYPDPPQSFRVTPEVELAYRRWVRFRQGLEPLPSMAYFFLTHLESIAGSRRQVAETFGIDFEVLQTLGRLSSTRGDQDTARKIERTVPLRELSGGESHWLEQTVRILIRRLGEHASGAPQPLIRMQDLPAL